MLLLALVMADTVSGAARSATPPAQITASAALQTAAVPPPASVPGDGSTNAGAPNPSAPPVATTPAAVPDPAPVTTDSPASTDQSAYLDQPRDPWVKANRAIFSFDTTLERSLLAPVAHGYSHVVPRGVRYHLTSALFNLGEPLTAADDLLQLRFGSMGKAVIRFVLNSTVGIAGLFDVAKTSGIPIHISDFGQTLGRYGVKAGPYVVLPLLGPSNVRDGIGRLVDTFLDPMQFLIGGITSPEGASLFVFEGVDWRSRSDDTLKAVYSATDPYAFTRSAYAQFRAAAVLEATGKQAVLPDFDAEPGTH